MSLRYLTDENFKVVEGKKGPILATSVPGICVVLFYSKNCKWCQNALPIFNTLPSSIRTVTFAALNVSVYQSVAEMSNATIAPITEVPYIILFVGQKPFIKYKGKITYNEIGRFVFEMSKRLNSKQNTFSLPNNEDSSNEMIENQIPAYGICTEYNCVDDVCYLNFNKTCTLKTS